MDNYTFEATFERVLDIYEGKSQRPGQRIGKGTKNPGNRKMTCGPDLSKKAAKP